MSLSNYQPTFETYPPEPALPAWKLELNAKLAAHRQRRPALPASESESHTQQHAGDNSARRSNDGSGRSASVAARVAERYANAPSYSEFLAASAAAAAAAAETAAFASRQAQDAAESFARLSRDHAAGETATWHAAEAPTPAPSAAIEDPRSATVEHPQPLPARGLVLPRPSAPATSLFANTGGIVDAIAEATVPAAVGLPAKLIEFPRELIAPRKSRPRIAEGPLVEAPLFEQVDLAEQANPSALRIFEVEGAPMAGEQEISMAQGSAARPAARGGDQGSPSDKTRPAAPKDQAAPEWQSIRLGEHPASPSAGPEMDWESDLSVDHRSSQTQPVLYTASLADRAMGALVDTAVVGLAFLLFVLVFAACTAHPPLDKTALVCGGVVLGGLFLFYQWLFMSFGGGTLGMRYAQIAICTFEEENPTRHTMRRRVVASVLSLLPLGLGFLWALFDEDSLGWHDRITRSYQRSYR